MNPLDRLFTAWLAGPLGDDDARQLQDLLREPEGRRRWRALADLDGALAELGAAIAAEPAHASPVSTRRLRRRPVRRQVWPWAMAAGLLLAAATGWLLREPAAVAAPAAPVVVQPPAPVADPALPEVAGRRVARGESITGPSEVSWPDGSLARLADGSQARLPQTGRGLELLAGEVTVQAAPQPPGQAFAVVSAHARCSVVGTRFSVRCDATSTTLQVEEGRVSFQPVGGEARMVAAGGQAFAGQANPVATGLIGWWPLDDGQGSEARDASGLGHPGQIRGALWTQAGLRFAGRNDHVAIAADGALATAQDGDYSLSAWYRPEVLPPGDEPPNRDALAVIAGRSGWTLGLHLDHDGRFFMQHFLADHQPQTADSPPLAVPGRWHHLAGVVSRRLGRTWLAVDGALLPPATWTPGAAGNAYAATQPWVIGIGIPGDPECRWPAQGLIRGVRVYDRALDGHEILRLTQEY